jgi:hypothetical protein
MSDCTEIFSVRPKEPHNFLPTRFVDLATLLTSAEEAQTMQVTADKSAWRPFKPQAALKPSFLENTWKQNTSPKHLETKHFTQLFQSYCLDGYQGSPPKNPIHIHLQPLIEATWWMSLVQRGITDNKILEEVIEIILEESDARNPLHSRRMELLRTQKSRTHSDFLYCLEQQADLIDMKTLTQEALFLEQSDQEMAKIFQDILSKNLRGDLPLLRQEIKMCRIQYMVHMRNTQSQAVSG